MQVGAELKRARIAAGMTQEQLSLAAQVDRPYLSLLEHDRKSPTIEMLSRICGALKIRPSIVLARAERVAKPGKQSKKPLS